MHARHRSAIILGILALGLFLVRWPLDDAVSDPNTWKWRPSPTEGTDFFTSVFRGGGGTPAVFAMLGGQRYMVANIMWNYSDVLFHKGQLREMVDPLEATVALNPSFTEAWSLYSWHLAWNIYSSTTDPVEKKKWMDAGIVVTKRAIAANPDVPSHRTDLARIYMEREGNYRKALAVMQPVVESGRFKPRPPEMQSTADPSHADIQSTADPSHDDGSHQDPNFDGYDENYWDPYFDGHRLAIIYRKLCIFTGDWSYLEKAIATYQRCLQLNPKDKSAPRVIRDLQRNMHNAQWLARQRQIEGQVRVNFGWKPIPYGKSMEEIFPDGDPALETAAK